MKRPQRLEESRLEEALCERGLLLASVTDGRDKKEPLSCSLVNSGEVGDWDLSKVVSEVFQLPFLPVEYAPPPISLWDELPQEVFREYCIVPLCRHGALLTVVLPGFASTQVLDEVAKATGLRLSPVVGTVLSNQRWLEDQAIREPQGPVLGGSEGPTEINDLEANLSEDLNEEWGSLFDEGEAAVQEGLTQTGHCDDPCDSAQSEEPELSEGGEAADSPLPPIPNF